MRGAAALLAVAALAVAIAAACAGDEPADVAVPTPATTVAATATGQPTTSPTTAAATAITTPPPTAAAQGLWLIDARTGERTVLFESSEAYVRRPSFTPAGGGFWVSTTDSEGSSRYGMDGVVQDRIEGASGVVESPYGPARAYWRQNADRQTRALVVEHDGATLELPGRALLPAFAPGGALLAYVDMDRDTDIGAFTVLDLASQGRRVLATGIGLCPCDGTPALEWSPSGRYVTYVSFGPDYPNPTPEQGSFVADVLSGDVRRLSDSPRALAYPPWHPTQDLIAFARDETLYMRDMTTGEERLLASTPDASFYGFDPDWRQVVVTTASGPPYVYETIVLDATDGHEVVRWSGNGATVWTSRGPAVAIYSYTRADASGCDGLLLHHPALPEAHCIEDGDGALWSSDGRYLAFIRQLTTVIETSSTSYTYGSWELVILDAESADERVVTGDPLPERPLMYWNLGGTHLLVMWPSGE